MQSPYEDFEKLVRKILLLNDFSIAPLPSGHDRDFDFLGTLGSDTWAIEAKFYRIQRAQANLVESAALRLSHRGAKARARKGMLVISSYLPIQLSEQLEKDFNLTFIDGADLAAWAAKDPGLLSELQSLLEVPPEETRQIPGGEKRQVRNEKALVEPKPPEDTRGE